MAVLTTEVSVAIITAPRKQLVIDRSLESLFDQKVHAPHVFAEPGADAFYYKSQVVLHPNGERLGCFYNWWSAAKWMIEHTKTDYILMCEDDILWCKSGLQLMLDFINPTIVLNGWTPLVNATKGGRDWLPTANLNMYGLCGSLALLFPKKILADVIYNRNMTKINQVHLDTEIGFALGDLKINIFSHHPSIVTHIGAYISTFDLSVVGEETIDARRCYATCITDRKK